MGQRTQLHIKNNNQFYVIHYQWGYGKNMINNVENLLKFIIEYNIENDNLQKILLNNYNIDADGKYYNIDMGDNNNGLFLIDCDKKYYAFLAGTEDIPYVTFKVPFKYRKPLSPKTYLQIFKKLYDNDDYENSLFVNRMLDNNDYKLMNNDILVEFIKESLEFEKNSNSNKNAFL